MTLSAAWRRPVGSIVSGLSLILLLTAARPARDTRWSFGPVVPMAKDCRATVAVGDQIVTVGGTSWETTPSGAKVKRWSSKVFQLDTQTLNWRTLPEYPLQAGYAFAAAIGSRIYVVGGRGEDRGNAEVFVLDMSARSREWIAGPRLPEARWGQVGAVINEVIYVAGGSVGSPSPAGQANLMDDVLALDTKRPELGWQQVATLPRPKTQWQMAAGCHGEFYFFGGLVLTAMGAHESLVPQVESFALNISSRRWRQLRPLPAPIGSGAAVAIDSRSVIALRGMRLRYPGPRCLITRHASTSAMSACCMT